SDTSCRGQLKRKIASVFDTEVAYKILSNHTFALAELATDEFEIKSVNNKGRVEITANEQRMLLDQVKAVYGNHIERLNLLTLNAASQSSELTATKSNNSAVVLGDPSSIWHKVSMKLLEHYGEALHISWFSKLSAEEDKERKKLILKAPTNFISSWINEKYGYLINNLTNDYQYSCVIC
ncbi:MAG: DnaA N-terminal domain-containing protein, partial [Janthinobacterium lividum]